MADSLKAAAFAAGLSGKEKEQVDSLSKALAVHKTLLALPQPVAQKAYSNLPAEQKQSLATQFGTEQKPNRGWLGTAWHYTGGQVFGALNAASELVTRAYRTAAIGLMEGKTAGEAWKTAGESGENVFNPNRITGAREKYGDAAVDIAMRIAAGEKPEQIQADPSLTEEQKYYLKIADPRNKDVEGSDEKLRAAKDLFDDTISAVNAAKYSPGRQLANLVDAIVPGDFYENGLFYKLTSGATDALFRLRTDPFILAGKAKRINDLRKYSLDVVLGDAARGGQKLKEYFAMPKVQDFWNSYGSKLDTLAKAGNNTAAKAQARIELERMAPEFGPQVIKDFIKNDVTDARSAQAFFENSEDAFKIMDGKLGRKRMLLPTMDFSRKTRVAVLTQANKVFSVDNIGPDFVNAFIGNPATDDGIYRALTDLPEELAKKLKGLDKDALRFSTAQISRRIDNLKRKFTAIPMFEGDQFDMFAKDAYQKVYRLATTVMPTSQARLVAETFDGVQDLGKRKDIFYGLWTTIAEVRGLQATEAGQLIVRRLTEKGAMKFASSRVDEYGQYALFPSEMNQFASAPSLVDLDRAAFRGAWIKRALGVGNSDWVEKMTNAWSFLTLAGPRYAIRNAGEDLMINLALGKSVWGLTKDRYLATRLNTALQLEPGLTAAEKFVSNPLGVAMRFINGKEAVKYTDEIVGLEKKIATSREKIQELSKVIKTSTDDAVISKAKSEIATLRKDSQGNLVDQTRQIMARSLTEGRLNKVLSQLKLKPVDKESLDLLSEQVVYGDIENFFSVISEGSINFASGATYIDNAADLVKKLGVSTAELKIDLGGLRNKYAQAAGVRGFREIGLVSQSEPALISWALRIGFYGNDDLGRFVMARLTDNPEDEAKAIKEIFDFLGKNPKIMEDARITGGQQLDQLRYAQLAYKRVKDLFVRRNSDDVLKSGKLNEDLLNKIRSFDEEGNPVITGKLTLDDLPESTLDMPESVVGPELVPITNTNNYTTPIMQNGWTWLGLSNARISRQPIAIYEMIDIRKQMRKTGFEDAFLAKFTEGIEEGTEAYRNALVTGKKELAQIVEERAINNVVAYVDNPLVRSQISFSVRNFARFYRAQEDFYRRIYRLVKYNPEALQRAALTFDGVAHSGWVQEDDQGQLYFVYPGVEPIYKVMQGVLTGLGIKQDFKIPFPVQFGGAVKMLTPSLNPDSILPSFAGPAAALPISLVSNLVNVASPGNGDTLVRYALGKYAVDQPVISRLMPAHVNRALLMMDQDERNSQYASAYRKAVTYLEAAGKGLPQKRDALGNIKPPTAGELEDYRQRVRNATLGILATRFIYGFVAPASPSVQLKSDMAEWIRDAGRANWKQNFNKLREQYNGDYNAAMAKWIELYPNQIPYTVTESERQTVATFGYAQESGDFVDNHKGLFKDFPQGAAFLIPHKGGFSFDAYQTMANMGLTKNKRVEDYLREVQTASALQEYYAKKEEFDNSLTFVGNSQAKTVLRQQFNTWKDRFFAGNPLVAEELNLGGQKKIDRLNALSDLQKMLEDPTYRNIRPDVQAQLAEMVKVYNDYQNQKDILQFASVSRVVEDSYKESVIQRLKQLAEYNENTQAAYDVVFSSLLNA